jgi:hypothetical protein
LARGRGLVQRHHFVIVVVRVDCVVHLGEYIGRGRRLQLGPAGHRLPVVDEILRVLKKINKKSMIKNKKLFLIKIKE